MKKYIYFPIVRYRYKRKGHFVEEQHQFDNIPQCYLFFQLYLRPCSWYRMPVYDRSVDRDRYHGEWLYCRNVDSTLRQLYSYLLHCRHQAINNARKGVELPY